MINPNELRIGNYVQHGDYIITVKEILGLGINEEPYDGGCEYDFEYLDPIPLTEDILVKCGLDPNFLELDHDFKPIGSDGNIQIRYLHQLQNFYFAVTGKELNILFE